MPVDFTKLKASASTNGKLIPVAATATPGTTIHTSVAGLVDWDEIWVYAVNIDTAAHTLTLEWGGTATGDKIVMDIPVGAGLVLVAPGLVLNNELIVKAFADAASKINLAVYVNRIAVL